MGRGITADIYPVHINELLLIPFKSKAASVQSVACSHSCKWPVKANTVAYQQVRPSDCIDPLRSMKRMLMSTVGFSVGFWVLCTYSPQMSTSTAEVNKSI